MEQVQETLQPFADSAFCGDGGHVHVVDHILGSVRHRHLSGHRGTGQGQQPRSESESCNSLPGRAKLANDVQCHSSCQRQYQALLNSTITA